MTNEEAIEVFKNDIEICTVQQEQACDMAIKVLEQTRWIPVTEDAPPKGTICLWCNKQGSVFISEITYRAERISYVGKHGYFSNGLENHGNIVAWMPLPEPYKVESEDK